MDGRNWINGEPAFTSIIAIHFALPDETDLLELGVRPALAYVDDAVGLVERYGVLRYRRQP